MIFMTEKMTSTNENKPMATYEVIDCDELAKRLHLPPSWIRDQVRSRATDPIPNLKFGRYVRFRWGSPELTKWIERRMN